MQIIAVNYQLFHLINDPGGRLVAVGDMMGFAATWFIFLIVAFGLVAVAIHRRRVRPALAL